LSHRFYITTAIDYVNGRPHLGHAYEKVMADALARFHRQRGDQTYFLTGTDEHGQKVARAAEQAGNAPQAFVDQLVPSFVEAWRRLEVAYDQFIRTTSQKHQLAVQELFRRLWDARSPRSGKPVLYQDEYVGLYCEGCEAFKQEKDLDSRGRCPIHKRKPKEIRETNFFFRLSEYDEALLKHLSAHPQFIEPEYRRNEVLNVIREGLQDISVSRPNIPWGIALSGMIPDSAGHTAYVWPDALLNYLSAIGWPERRFATWWLARAGETGGPGGARQDEFQELDGQGRPGAAWAGTGQPLYTNAFHLIGKDISRFHCVLWPALLLAAGVPLPRQVWVHGFINLGGERLSKSAGVVIDPIRLAEAVGADALRFYLLHAIPTGRDGDFTVEQLVEHCNTHLANGIGNLLSRTLTLAHKYCGGREPAAWDPAALREPGAREALEALIGAAGDLEREFPKGFEEVRLHEALHVAATLAMRADEFVDRGKPWAIGKDESRRVELETTLSAVLEVLRLLALALWPVLPAKCEELWKALGQEGTPGAIADGATRPRFGARSAPRALGPSGILFPRLEVAAVRATLTPPAPAAKGA